MKMLALLDCSALIGAILLSISLVNLLVVEYNNSTLYGILIGAFLYLVSFFTAPRIARKVY